METIIELRNISKTFKNKSVFEGINFSILSNQVIAIAGKNGSGKSSLLKIISGLIKPDNGKVLLRKGKPVRIGYVPEVAPQTILFTPLEYLTHMGIIQGLSKEWLKQRIGTLLKIFNLEDDQNTRINHFSKGMKQKVMIMQAMLEETDLLILDEPLSGLDLKAQAELEELLITLKDRNISIIFTCHETRMLEKLVDKMLVINQGKLILTDSNQGQKQLMNKLVFEFANSESINSIRNNIIIVEEKENKFGSKLIELHISDGQTDKVVRELIDFGGSIKLLEPLYRKEIEFLKQFQVEGEVQR